jgi:hypothetical protein
MKVGAAPGLGMFINKCEMIGALPEQKQECSFGTIGRPSTVHSRRSSEVTNKLQWNL